MTPRISLVAVCCSNDSLSSWNSRDVLECNHGLVGKGFEQLDLRWREGAHLGATRDQTSNKFSLVTKGNGQESARVANGTQHWEIVLRGTGVGNVKCAVLAHPAKMRLINTNLAAGGGYGTEMSPRNNHGPFAQSQCQVFNSTNPRGALDDGVKTGCTSVGERLIMPSTSAVAV